MIEPPIYEAPLPEPFESIMECLQSFDRLGDARHENLKGQIAEQRRAIDALTEQYDTLVVRCDRFSEMISVLIAGATVARNA